MSSSRPSSSSSSSSSLTSPIVVLGLASLTLSLSICGLFLWSQKAMRKEIRSLYENIAKENSIQNHNKTQREYSKTHSNTPSNNVTSISSSSSSSSSSLPSLSSSSHGSFSTPSPSSLTFSHESDLKSSASIADLSSLDSSSSSPPPLLIRSESTSVSVYPPSTEWSIRLTPNEVETMRSIFNLFDTTSSGRISTQQIKELHEKLGEPLTDDEAKNCIGEIDREGKGYVSFSQFLMWWSRLHNSAGGDHSSYMKRFKLIRGKLESTDSFDVDRIVTRERGIKYTLEWRLAFYYKTEGGRLKPISPWHDIPLRKMGMGGDIYNMVAEIPKWSRAKFECSTTEPYNLIKQDTVNGSLRYYKYGDMMFNYGYLPCTWEDPKIVPPDVGYRGDSDPIDAVEIGSKQRRTGEVFAVKILGVLALIDSNECDWKIICIAIDDPLAFKINDIDDCDISLPGAIDAIRTYFRDYKSASGQVNFYAFEGQAMPKQYAINVIEETHQYWKTLHIVGKQDVIEKEGHKEKKVEPKV